MAHTITQAAHRSAQPAADALALAEAVAAPESGALLLDADNAAAGWDSIPAAAEGGQAFAVEVRSDVLALDDDHDGRALAVVADELRAEGVPVVEAASGREGHAHLFAVTGQLPEQLRTALVEACRARGLDVRAGPSRIRPPLSPHRLGGTSTLERPDTPEDALQALQADAPPVEAVRAVLDALSAPSPVERPDGYEPSTDLHHAAGLPGWARTLLATGDPEGRYPTRSEALWAVECQLAASGWSEDAAVAALLDSPLSAKADGKADPARWLREDYRRARRKAAPALGDAAEVRAEVARLRQVAWAYRWPAGLGVAPATLAKCLDAFLDVCSAAGRVSGLEVSVRQLAEGAGVGRGPAQRALGVFVAEGVLSRDRVGTQDRRATYSLRRGASPFRDGMRDSRSHPPNPWAPTVPLPTAAHDAWRHGGLGGSALRVFASLDPEDPVAAGDVAARCALSACWTRQLLARLEAHGLASRDLEGQWTRCRAEDVEGRLAAAAEALDTAGKGASQRQAHKAERRAHAEALARADADHLADDGDSDGRTVLDPTTGEVWRLDDLPASPPRRAEPPPGLPEPHLAAVGQSSGGER